jgi:hypothetical protein
MSWSLRGAPEPTGRIASRTWSTSTTRTPSRSCWCKTTPNTHTPASLYEAFAPAEAKRLADKLELHDTPKHGSWLNMAEIELAVLAGQCPDRRLADRATLEREVEAWQAARNGVRSWGQLAVHDRRCPDQAQAPLPRNSQLTS